eukprot:gnl/Spiro4/21028_TR10258_c0_g1_i1.p1 gnl/Spiro4/21028_TR10258_c0_g1~~gnl/Spiro4/21028_TR10258_c0_g1_i1.p1  ORF type:complete len:191 (-),score=29.73 gnl/Spiro4/21028_TR10258_c0_g1_i1:70-585(-)
MPSTVSNEYTLKYPWHLVAQAVFRKYPSSHTPHVLNVETAQQKLVGGRLHSRRIQVLSDPYLPAWMLSMAGSAFGFSVEDSVVDRAVSTLSQQTRNLSYSNFLSLNESVTYTPHPENPAWTLFKQNSVVEVHLWGLGTVESFVAGRLVQNAQKGRAAIEDACRAVAAQDET